MQGNAKQRLCQSAKPLIFKGFTQVRGFWAEKDAGAAKTKLPPTGKRIPTHAALNRPCNEIVDMEKSRVRQLGLPDIAARRFRYGRKISQKDLVKTGQFNDVAATALDTDA